MIILLIKFPENLAAALREILAPASYLVVAADSISRAPSAIPPAAAHGAFLSATDLDAKAIEDIRELREAGYETVYVVCETARDDWLERAYMAGASFVFSGRLRGSMIVEVLARRAPSKQEAPRDTAHAPQSSCGIPNTSGRVQMLAEFRDFSRMLRTNSTADALVPAYLGSLREKLSLNRAALFMVGDRGARMDCAFAVGVQRDLWAEMPIPLHSGIGVLVQSRQVAMHVSALPHCKDGANARHLMFAMGMQWAVPFASDGEFLGVFLAGSRATGASLAGEEIEIMFLLLEELAGALVANRKKAATDASAADLLHRLDKACLFTSGAGDVLFANKAALTVLGHGSLQDLKAAGLPAPLVSFARSGDPVALGISSGNLRFTRLPLSDHRGGVLLLEIEAK